MKYAVFARIDPGDDLLHIGDVDAATDRLAKVHARTTYDEEDWATMAVVRETNLLKVPTDAPKRPDGESP